MNIFPAIDLIGGQAVRLQKGDYGKKTVYSKNPSEVAKGFKASGAKFLHIVDLDGAKSGGTENFETISTIAKWGGLKVQVGGGIRSKAVIERYINAGVMRVIIGTAAVTDPDFLKAALDKYGDKIAVGVDVKDGFVATHGWTEVSEVSCLDFCEKMQKIGVKTIICTDISKDGMLSGTNLPLYKTLSQKLEVDIIASGGVTSLDDIAALCELNLYGAILGKALYTGNIDLEKAINLSK